MIEHMITVVSTTIKVPAVLLDKLKLYAERDGCTVEELILRQLEMRAFQEENK